MSRPEDVRRAFFDTVHAVGEFHRASELGPEDQTTWRLQDAAKKEVDASDFPSAVVTLFAQAEKNRKNAPPTIQKMATNLAEAAVKTLGNFGTPGGENSDLSGCCQLAPVSFEPDRDDENNGALVVRFFDPRHATAFQRTSPLPGFRGGDQNELFIVDTRAIRGLETFTGEFRNVRTLRYDDRGAIIVMATDADADEFARRFTATGIQRGQTKTRQFLIPAATLEKAG